MTKASSSKKSVQILGPHGIIQQFTEIMQDKSDAIPDVVPIAPQRQPELPIPETFLSPMVTALSEQVQAPKSLALNSILSSLTIATQAYADVVLPINGGYNIPINNYFLTVAETGDRKSACDGLIMDGIRQAQNELIDQYEIDKEAYDMLLEAWDIQRKELIKEYKDSPDLAELIGEHAKIKPLSPLSPIVMSSDATPEGLFQEILNGQRSLILSTDEGGTFLGGYSMGDSARKRAATGFYNELWTGKVSTRLRKSAGSSILRGYRFSMHVMIQPRILAESWKDSDLQDNGFWGRFLAVSPDSLWSKRPLGPRLRDEQIKRRLEGCTEAIALWKRITKKIYQTPQPFEENKRILRPPLIGMSTKAKDCWVDFYDEIEGNGGPLGKYATIRGLANKAAEHAARLAGCFEVFEKLSVIDTLDFELISLAKMEQATALVRWYLESTMRMMETAPTAEEQRLQKIYDTIAQQTDKRDQDEFTLSDLARWTREIKNVKDAALAVEELRQNGMVVFVGDCVIEGKKRANAWRVLREEKE